MLFDSYPRIHQLHREQLVPRPLDEVFDFFAQAGNLERITSRAFEDVQVKGPYRLCHHRHEFRAAGGGTLVQDHVRYSLPLGPLGELAHAAFVERDLARIFAFRYAAVKELLA